ncbi:DNA-binding GntR family transcriptional regulator [Angulomicrobium tetraedrale]|uniref:DNA-binding GntR family transcriptional regulator n=1 Tax=Ancylobacter tetraedralis TaxID=217068 RepID=A0A839Z6I0_9HYPH|nr:GntR family transcriptional regulator [Ancylobacter tetraedralis]MBB3771292.1 DNA-binding GntR family transcriptional regulator [Ancylobacter tetraedralis]
MAERRRAARHNHQSLAQQIVALALDRGLKAGEHMPEQAIAEACGVSRTPIRAAFKILEKNNILIWKEEQGYFLARSAQEGLSDASIAAADRDQGLFTRILADRAARRIADVQSVSALARRYSASRVEVLNALKILSRDGIVSQLPGSAWAFQPLLDTPPAIAESFAFRLTLEPQAILTPGFALDPTRASALRAQMRAFQLLPDGRLTAAGFQRLDIDFHVMIAEGSANRFVQGALLAHHRLRRMAQKEAAPPPFRQRQAMEEHLDILDSLERTQLELAADQMVLHLRRSGIRRPETAGRGMSALLRGAQPAPARKGPAS